MQDVRLAIRALRATPIVTAAAVLSFALGIGANTAIFSLLNSVLLRPLPLRDPERLVTLTTVRDAGRWWWSYAMWQEFRGRRDLFAATGAWGATRFDLSRGGQTDPVDGLFVSGSFFDTLGVSPRLGRLLRPDDDVRGGGAAGAVAVISHGFWQRHFGGGNVIGTTLTIDRVPFTIVGVTPASFFGVEIGRTFDVAVPLGDEPLLHGRDSWLDRPGNPFLFIVGRLADGRSRDETVARLRNGQRAMWEAAMPPTTRPEFREQYLSESFDLRDAAGGASNLRHQYARSLTILMGLVVLVLLIACANIAALQLARGTSRGFEMSVRRALGASRAQLVRQLLIESAIVAGAGAAIGAWLGTRAAIVLVQRLSTANRVIFLDLSPDWRVLAFTAAAGALAVAIFGVLPAFRASGSSPIDALRDHGRATEDRSRHAGLATVLVGEVAVSVVLIVAAGLFVRSFAELARRDTGFDRSGALLVRVDSRRAAVAPAQRMAFAERVEDAVRAVPGVASVATSIVTPGGEYSLAGRAAIDGARPLPDTGNGPLATANVITPGWFGVMGTPLVAGRDFDANDRAGAPLVAIVNRSLEREALGSASAIGRTIAMSTPTRNVGMTIIGVVADSVYFSLRETEAPPTLFTPLSQFYLSPSNLSTLTLTVRPRRGLAAPLTAPVAGAIRAVDPDLALTFQSLEGQLDASIVQERSLAMLSASFGGLALLLAGIGLYGVTAYAVARRRMELGIRMALGAGPADVVRLVLSRVSMQVSLGVAIGMVVSLWASTFVVSLLYGLAPHDLVTLAGAAAMLAAVAVVAGAVPAWRASRLDAATVLREG
jgi:predicted permease